jgi:hypothetical protein
VITANGTQFVCFLEEINVGAMNSHKNIVAGYHSLAEFGNFLLLAILIT